MKKLVQMFVLMSVVSVGFQAKADLAAELKEREQVAKAYDQDQANIAAIKEKARHEKAVMNAKADLNTAVVKTNQAIELKLKATLVETKLTEANFKDETQGETFKSAQWLLKLSDGTICRVSHAAAYYSSYGMISARVVATCILQNGQTEYLNDLQR